MAVTERSGLVKKKKGDNGEPKPGPSRYGAIKEPSKDYRAAAHSSTYFTRRDCLIVLIVVGMALTAIVVSLVFGLPALEAKRLAMLNETTTEAANATSEVNVTTLATNS